MSSRKERKIRSLRKAHIWPSVVFLFLSMLLSLITLMDVTALMIGFLTDERYTLTTDNAVTISRTLDVSAGSEEEALKIFSNDTEAVYVLDADGNTITGFGGQTYDRNTVFDHFIDDDIDDITTFDDTDTGMHFIIKIPENA